MKLFSWSLAAVLAIGTGALTGCEDRSEVTDTPIGPTYTEPAETDIDNRPVETRDPALDARPLDPIEDRGVEPVTEPQRETPVRDALEDDGLDINIDRGTGNPNDDVNVNIGGGEGVNVDVPNP